MLGITEKEQNIINDILKSYKGEYTFYYFGSRVKGNYSATSDADILIRGQKAMPFNILEDIKEKFDQSMLPYIVNFIDYYNISNDFYNNIKDDMYLIEM